MKRILLLSLVAVLSGCVTQKEWVATGGSRADGVVRLSYEYGMFESPQVDDAKGITVAASRCAVWGYQGAESFGGVIRQCTERNNSGCIRYMVTREYQCTGKGDNN